MAATYRRITEGDGCSADENILSSWKGVFVARAGEKLQLKTYDNCTSHFLFLQQADSLFGNCESKSQWSIWQKNCIAFFFLSPESTIAGMMPHFCITSEGDARSAKVQCLLWLPAYGPTVHQETALIFNGCAQVCKQSLFAQDARHDNSMVNWLRNIVKKKKLMCCWTKKKILIEITQIYSSGRLWQKPLSWSLF